MSGIAHNLVRRAVDATQQHYNTVQGDNDDQIKQIAMWGMVLIWVTGVLYFAMMSAVSQPVVLGCPRIATDRSLLDILHLRRCHCNLDHDRNPYRYCLHSRLY